MADGPNSAGWGELAVLTLPQIGSMYLQEVVKECPLGYLTAVLIKAKPGDLWLVHVGAQPLHVPLALVPSSAMQLASGLHMRHFGKQLLSHPCRSGWSRVLHSTAGFLPVFQ